LVPREGLRRARAGGIPAKSAEMAEKNGDSVSLFCNELKKSAQVIENKGANISLLAREE